MPYCVAVFSMRSRWLRRNPDAAKLRIRVLPKSKLDLILVEQTVEGHLPRHYRRLVQEEGISEFEDEIAAWDAAVVKRDDLREQRRSVELELGKPEHCLYVFEMDNSVWSDKQFVAMNPRFQGDEVSGACVYVGKTTKKREERYAQHRDKTQIASTKWGKQYFLRPFEVAYRGDLIHAYQQTGEATDCLTHYAALKSEYRLRCWLQSIAIAAYSR